MERRKFTREFKLEAVRLIKDRGVSYVQASQDLNVHPSRSTNLEVVRRLLTAITENLIYSIRLFDPH